MRFKVPNVFDEICLQSFEAARCVLGVAQFLVPLPVGHLDRIYAVRDVGKNARNIDTIITCQVNADAVWNQLKEEGQLPFRVGWRSTVLRSIEKTSPSLPWMLIQRVPSGASQMLVASSFPCVPLRKVTRPLLSAH